MKDDENSKEQTTARPEEECDEPPTRPLEPLPTPIRAVFFIVGSILLIIGLVALALPVVPQVIPLASGAALLSLASDKVYMELRTRLRRWPWIWKPVRAFRRRVHGLFAGYRDDREEHAPQEEKKPADSEESPASTRSTGSD